MTMTEKYKILAKFIKDMSVETKDTQTYLFVKENIRNYNLKISINSKPLKNKMIEVCTTLKYQDKLKGVALSTNFDFLDYRIPGFRIEVLQLTAQQGIEIFEQRDLIRA